MEATAKTSWRRLSDKPGNQALANEPVRILIVDSDISSASSLELMLHASGYWETRVAYSGHAALAIAADFHPSVGLVELNLLDMSGHELARVLREHGQSRDLRLIALTSNCAYAGHERTRVTGFERCLLKPLAALDVSGAIANATDRIE